MSPVNVSSIGSYIREQREQAKISIRQLAQAAGVSNPYLSQVERGLRRPSADILQQIAKGLRISAEALYVQAGVLDEDNAAETTVTRAIMADTEITDRQKRMMIDIYESFRKEVRAEEDARAAAEEQGEPVEPADAGETGETDDPIAEAVAESGHDPVVEVVAAAEAEPWADPPAAAEADSWTDPPAAAEAEPWTDPPAAATG
jgi:transcriptional regulator with XRE-family HTH domain